MEREKGISFQSSAVSKIIHSHLPEKYVPGLSDDPSLLGKTQKYRFVGYWMVHEMNTFHRATLSIPEIPEPDER
jgi:hypothetical protein